MAAGADLYTLHARALADLEPDLILTQDPCRVCALPSGHVEDALDYLGCQADVLPLDPHSLAEVFDSILAIGRRAGVPDSAARLVGDLRAGRRGRAPCESAASVWFATACLLHHAPSLDHTGPLICGIRAPRRGSQRPDCDR